MAIHLLPDLLVNQIAAGEVIERPASVVKELLENALDAEAQRITIELEQGGIERITVADDGFGISEEELPLALAPHATSKISQAEDLDAISTLGFRGEALASIASVSRLQLRSRTSDVTAACQLDVEGSQVADIRPAAGPVGSSVTVRNLFFNTPARRKFLRTIATEFGHCHQIVRTLAMSHANTGFRLLHDGRLALELSPEDSPRRRVIALLGGALEDRLIEVSVDAPESGGLAIWGLVGLPDLARNTTKMQHVFLNGRAIRDKSIQHALREAYRGLIEPGKHPTVALFLEMDPRLVDVNVHPTKAEVRFRDQSVVHGAVLRNVRSALAESDLTPQLEVQSSETRESMLSGMAYTDDTGFGSQVAEVRSEGRTFEESASVSVSSSGLSSFVDHFKRLDPTQRGFVYREVAAAMQASDGASAAESEPDDALPAARPIDPILQIHNSFIVTQDEQGIVIVDQHALHERVMFELLIERIGKGSLESQRLLMPETIEVTVDQIELLERLSLLLRRIGVEAEAIGPRAVAVHAFPSILFERKVEIRPFLQELFDLAQQSGFAPSDEAALHQVIDMMACKAAVKAGDRLQPGEMEELLRQRDVFDRSSNCPHGRPTTIRIPVQELEKRFGRR